MFTYFHSIKTCDVCLTTFLVSIVILSDFRYIDDQKIKNSSWIRLKSKDITENERNISFMLEIEIFFSHQGRLDHTRSIATFLDSSLKKDSRKK